MKRKFLILLICIIFFLQTISQGAYAGHTFQDYHGLTENKEDEEKDKCEETELVCCPQDGQPVYLYNGEHFYTHIDLEIPGLIPIQLRRHYSAFSLYNLEFGYGWIMNYDYVLFRQHDGNLLLRRGCYDRDVFTNNGDSTFSSPENEFEIIIENQDATYTLEKKDGQKYQFDINGCLSSIDDTNGNQLVFTYDPAGKLPVNGISPFSNIATPIVIASAYRLIKIDQYAGGNGLGRYIEFSYDDNGRIISARDHAGREVFYVYDSSDNGDLLSFIDAAGNPYNYTYDNHLMTEFTGMGCSDCGTTTVEYDSENRVSREIRGSSILEFSYLIPGRKTQVTHKVYNDSTHQFIREYTKISEFDGNKNLIKETIQNTVEDIVWQYTYNSLSLITQKIDPNGNITDYTYDGNGNLLTETRILLSGDTLSKTYTYNDVNKKLSEEIIASWDIRIYRIEYTYYDNGNLREEKRVLDDSTTHTTTYTYKLDGSIETVTYPKGNVLAYEYNNYGQVIREYDPEDTNRQTSYTYDQWGNRISITDANNNTATYTYDNLNRSTSITNALGQKTIYTYTGANLTQIENGKTATGAGHITRITYDAMNRKTAVIKETAQGEITTVSYTYDSEENVLRVTDANSNTTSYSYNAIGRLAFTSNSLGHTSSYSYDKLNNLTQTTDAEGNVTEYSYNGLNQLIQVTQSVVNGEQPITSYTYNGLGNITTVTDAENRITTNTYDRLGRFTLIEDPLTNRTQYFYDANADLDYKIDANGARIDYSYNNYNELITITYPDKTVTFSYDNAGNLRTYADGTTSANYEYDNLSRLSEVTTTYPFGAKTISYTYDRFGNRETATYPEIGTIDYAYDDFNRLISVTASASEAVSYEYDNASRLINKTLGNGTEIVNTYDNANRLLSITPAPVIPVQAEARAGISYTHDKVGNRLTKTDLQGEHVYDYDNLYRLTTSTIPNEFYTYDKIGNRLTNQDYDTWNYNEGNQLETVIASEPQANEAISFDYDNNGNTTTKTTPAGETTYTWDKENRLTTVNSTLSTVNFYYDPFGKRLKKEADGSIIWYVYDQEDIIAIYKNDGTLLKSFIHGQGIDEPIRMTDHTTANDYYYLSDGLGSIIEIQDTNQTTVEKYQYDSFGNPAIINTTDEVISQSAIGNIYLYTAREWDKEIGLYFYRARYYDAEVGRFLSEDSIGFNSGVNFYIYVKNNPLKWADPWGLHPRPGQEWSPGGYRYHTEVIDGHSHDPYTGSILYYGSGSAFFKCFGCFVQCVLVVGGISFVQDNAVRKVLSLAAKKIAKEWAKKMIPVYNVYSTANTTYGIADCTIKCIHNSE